MDINSSSDEVLRKIADEKRQQVWNMLGFTGDPTMICLFCNKPCEWDKKNDIILCNRCGQDWTLESMHEDCERMIKDIEK